MTLQGFDIGTLSFVSAQAQSFHWKNYLSLHAQRFFESTEALSQVDSDTHSTILMIEREFVICSFLMRRMLEMKLISDNLSKKSMELSMWDVSCKKSTLKMPMQMAGGYLGYQFSAKKTIKISYKKIVNYIIHAQFFSVAYDSGEERPRGIAFNSDYSRSDGLFLIKIEQFTSLTEEFLKDFVSIASDRLDHESGRVHSIRS